VKNYAQRTAEQMRCPTGFSGMIAASLMKKQNTAGEKWTVQQMGIIASDHILEIGFGHGVGLREALHIAKKGLVEGIDISPQMIKVASRQNREVIDNGKLILHLGNAEALPFKDQTFDKVFAVNVYYFWSNPEKPLAEIYRVLKKNGKAAIYIIEKDDLLKMSQARTDIFKIRSINEIQSSLEMVGFMNIQVTKKKEANRTGINIISAR
jgi:ubiquinone/menaquinone biosynthesis C-methylase UbiE